MFLALALAALGLVEEVPIIRNPRMVYLWNGAGLITTAQGALWATTSGRGHFYLEPGTRIKRVWSFVATDTGSRMESDLNLSNEQSALSLRAFHKEAAYGNYDAWNSQPQDWLVRDGDFEVQWTCRVTGRDAQGEMKARCHFGMQLEIE